MRAGASLWLVGTGLVAIALGGCGGRFVEAGAGGAPSAALSVRVRFTAALDARAIVASVVPSAAGAAQGHAQSFDAGATVCAAAGAERICTLALRAPVGTDDVTLTLRDGRTVLAAGTALRRDVEPEGSALALAFDGSASAWALSPSTLISAADGQSHDVLFAVQPIDAQGFVLVQSPAAPGGSVSTHGDRMHDLSIVSDAGGRFDLRYDGAALPAIGLTARASGAREGDGAFAALEVAPTSLQIANGASATVTAALPGWDGAFEARAEGSACSVSPHSATPSSPGRSVPFVVHARSTGSCTLRIATRDTFIAFPIALARAHVDLGIGPSKIQHVVVMLQENRSFDNIFGGRDDHGKAFPGADTVSHPLPGEPTPHDHLGHKVKMATGTLEACYDPDHNHPQSMFEVDGGKMDGFDEDPVLSDNPNCPSPPPKDYAYRYIEYSEVSPYWEMGEQYAISDRMFEPFSSASYGAHLFLVAGQSANTIDNPSGSPWGCDAGGQSTVPVVIGDGESGSQGVFSCFTAATLVAQLDAAGVPWRYYGAKKSDFGYNWIGLDSFSAVRYGSEWSTNVITPPSQFLTDLANPSYQLAGMTWVTPTLATSDHPISTSNMGPSWVASVVNALGASSYWKSTAIFVSWDDWGGWYDHVPPPVTGPVSLGVRTGLIVVSPYAKTGYVSHVVHTTGSILHFAEEALGVASLGQEDARTDDLTDAFDFTQTPRQFTPFKLLQPLDAVRSAASRPETYTGPGEGD